MNEYSIRYRTSHVGHEGWLSASREVLEFRCTARSKVEALMRLDEARAAGVDSAALWVCRAQAHRLMGQLEQAVTHREVN